MRRVIVGGVLMWSLVALAAPQQFEVRCAPRATQGFMLHAAGVIEGPANEQGILKPIRKREHGAWVELYTIANEYPKSVWCGYGKLNEIILTHPLPHDVKKCQVRYRLNDKVDKILCVR